MENTGSFGAAIGGSDALKQAMQRRGIDSSALDQVSPAAPSGPSPVAPAVQGGMDMGGVNMGGMGASPDATLGAATAEEKLTPRSAEMEIALKALADTVKTENKIAETIVGSK